ncbi:hypothetical protein [Streptomyces altiplanensis]
MSDHEETRLALVLNGGVSLAVWMGGVTHEIDALRRASSRVFASVDATADCMSLKTGEALCDEQAESSSSV